MPVGSDLFSLNLNLKIIKYTWIRQDKSDIRRKSNTKTFIDVIYTCGLKCPVA